MLEVFRQACLLPLSYSASILKTLNIYRGWLMLVPQSKKNLIASEKLVEFWGTFIRNLVLVFDLQTSAVGAKI